MSDYEDLGGELGLVGLAVVEQDLVRQQRMLVILSLEGGKKDLVHHLPRAESQDTCAGVCNLYGGEGTVGEAQAPEQLVDVPPQGLKGSAESRRRAHTPYMDGVARVKDGAGWGGGWVSHIPGTGHVHVLAWRAAVQAGMASTRKER